MITFVIIYLLGALGFILHVFRLPKDERTKARIVELFLLYQLVFAVGLTSFLSFFGLTFLDDIVANYTDWPKCPYEQELANVNLAYGVLGILAIWLRKLFWVAIVIGFTIWIFGDAIHHFHNAYFNHIHSLGNEGGLVYTDLFVPIILCVTLYFYIKTHRVME